MPKPQLLMDIDRLSLSSEPLQEVLAQLAEHIQECFSADAAVLLEAQGDALVLDAASGALAASTQAGAGLAAGLELRTLRSDRPEQLDLDALDALDALGADSALLRGAGLRSLLVAPLQVADQRAGLVYIASAAPRRFTDEEKAQLGAVAGRLGLALALARQADRLRRINERQHMLQALTAQLSRRATPAQIADMLVEHVHDYLGGSASVVYLGDAGTLRLGAWRGFPAGALAQLQTLALDGELPLSVACREQRALFLGSPDEIARHFPALRPSVPVLAFAALPILVDGALAGGFAVSFSTPRPFPPEEREFMAALTHECGVALGRAALLAEAQRARRRLQILDSVTQQLVAMRGAEDELHGLAQAMVPHIADWCVIYVPRDGGIEVTTVAHQNPVFTEIAREEWRRRPVDPAMSWGAPWVLRTGQTEHLPRITEAHLRAAARDAEHLQMLRAAQLRSHIGVPLRAGPDGAVLGCVSLLNTAESGREFTSEDVALAEELAVRAALTLERARLYRAAEQASLAKDQFLAMLGHELRNPLAPIATALQLIRLKDTNQFDREHAIIERQVGHLQRLVDDLLDISRITRGKVELVRKPVTLSSVVGHAIEMVSPLIEQRQHHLSLQVVEDVTIEGDGGRLGQIFSNLLTNAARYTQPGGQLVVNIRREGEHGVVSVRDNGIGISPALLPHIFDPFVQGPGTTPERAGLGLGLALVWNLVRLHGGEVTASSSGPSHGSEFTVRFPLAVQRAAAAPAALPREQARSIRTRRVLIVDDNRDAADLLSGLLTAHGHEVTTAYDGAQALTVTERFIPEVAVLDLAMPVMDGFELAARLQERFGTSLRLFALTGYGQPGDRSRTQAAGFQRHFVKPVDLAELVEAIVSPAA